MNDPYKNLFKGIILILLTAVFLLFLSISLTACHSQRQATSTMTEKVELDKAASITTETAARSQWSSSLAIELDSFELLMPIPCSIDTAMDLPATFVEKQSEGRPHLHANMVVLRGKRASIGKADIAERNASRCAQLVDSVVSHRTMDKADHSARDTVGITKPPNITWWPLLILVALALGTYFLRRYK